MLLISWRPFRFILPEGCQDQAGGDDTPPPGLSASGEGDDAEAPAQQARGSRWLSQGDDEDADVALTPNEVGPNPAFDQNCRKARMCFHVFLHEGPLDQVQSQLLVSFLKAAAAFQWRPSISLSTLCACGMEALEHCIYGFL